MRAVVRLAVLAASLTAPAAVRAQVFVQTLRQDLPVITRVMPAGLERGKSTELTVDGERLDGLTRLLSAEGVRLLSVVESGPKQARLLVEVDAKTPVGIYPLHVLCKAGLSNPRLMCIDDLPQVVEQDEAANNTLAGADALTIPAAVSGVLNPGDQDHYRFHATAGQEVVVEVEAQRLGTALQPVLALFDAAGRELKSATIPPPDIAPDVRLVHTCAVEGDYVVRVHDLTYQGAAHCVYRLRIGPLRFGTTLFPLGGRRGEVARVTLDGGNLAAPVQHEVDLRGDVPWACTRLRIPLEGTTLTAPALFAVGLNPEAFEHEPNNAPDQANAVDTPTTINGRIEVRGDRDCFRFHATPGQPLVVRVLAEQLGSPLDAIVTIESADGNVVVTSDDRPSTNFEPPVVRPVVSTQRLDDPLVEFTAPAEGDFVLSLDDLHKRGGANFAYRIELAPRVPQFELIAQPGREPPQPNQNRQAQGQQILQEFNGQGTGALSLDRGGSGTIVVLAQRSGYDGPIRLGVEGLPEGVEAAETVIPAGQNQAVINCNAGFDAPSTAAFIRILGNADDGQTTHARLAQQPVVFSAMPSNGAVEHRLDAIAVGVSQQGAELAVRGELRQELVQGGKAEALVSIRRREGYAGEVTVSLVNLPSGLEATPATIAADQQQATVALSAALDIAPGTRSILLQGSMAKKDAKEPILATFPLRVRTLPWVELELVDQQIDVPQGGTARLAIALHRNGSLAAPIDLAAARLPRGLQIDSAHMPADQERFSLLIRTTNEASPSPIRRIIQLKPTATVDGRTIELPTLRFALKIVKP